MLCSLTYCSIDYYHHVYVHFVFRITAMCGDYYIGGREFDTLSDLIGYYTCYSDLLKGERLQHPVPPPEVRKLILCRAESAGSPITRLANYKLGEINKRAWKGGVIRIVSV